MTIRLTFFFGMLMFSSFGRFGDLLRSFLSTDFSVSPPESVSKDFGSSFLSEKEMCENLTRLSKHWGYKMCLCVWGEGTILSYRW